MGCGSCTKVKEPEENKPKKESHPEKKEEKNLTPVEKVN